MVASTAGQRAHSAKVEIELDPNATDRVRMDPVAQGGQEFLITREVVQHLPAEAEVVLRIDGCEDRRRVFLPDGLGQRGSKKSRIAKAD